MSSRALNCGKVFINGKKMKKTRKAKWAFQNANFSGFCLVTKLCLTLCNPLDYTCQAPLSLGFPKQAYWSGLPFLLQGIFMTQGLNLSLLHWEVDSLSLSHLGSPLDAEIIFKPWSLSFQFHSLCCAASAWNDHEWYYATTLITKHFLWARCCAMCSLKLYDLDLYT